jgi:hypothetical protein
MSVIDITQLIILIVIFGLIIWDIYAYIKKGTEATESWTIWRWANISPSFAFLFGMLIGHIFFSLTPPICK